MRRQQRKIGEWDDVRWNQQNYFIKVGGTQQVTPLSTVLISQLFTFHFMEPKEMYTFKIPHSSCQLDFMTII